MTGNKKLDMILLLLNGILTLGSAGAVFYSHKVITKSPTDQQAEKDKLISGALSSLENSPLKLPKKVVNLFTDRNRLRYLEVELNLEPFFENHKPILLDAEHIISDSLIQVGSNMSYSEINSITGKILFESRLRKLINQKLNSKILKKIYFSKFIVQ
ncbi:flagellar basal body-associated FliL family protein [Bacteriovoracaceae bacterium]|nr:flagellar basal body-associated FliL family protein [Bacteriovoracaceae bacterium]